MTQQGQWELPTRSSSYVVGLGPDGLQLDHWGPIAALPLPGALAARPHYAVDADVAALEYASGGTRQVNFSELLVDHGDGRTGAAWTLHGDPGYRRDEVGARLVVSFSDTTGSLALHLHTETSRMHDVVRRWARIVNTGDTPVTLHRAFSAAWPVPVGQSARIDYLAGAWGKEFTERHVVLDWGTFSIGSRGGVTGHQFAPLMVLRAAETDAGAPPEGTAYGIAMEWSGSWRMVAESIAVGDRVRVSGGVDDDVTTIILGPGETFEAPPMLGLWTDQGENGLADGWHRYQRTIMRAPLDPALRPIVYNSWFATRFDLRPAHQIQLAEAAADLGVETFVVDDGWFTGRDSTDGGLGDWEVDEAKFPAGLNELSTRVSELGMRFGLWIEPEAVSEQSDLYRRHPEWIYRGDRRDPVKIRNQFLLDLGRPEVERSLAQTLRRLLTELPISYLKWDMNRPVTDGGRIGDVRGYRWSVDHTQAYYRLLDLIRDDFAHVVVEGCAAGGARIDNAVLSRVDVVWPSDETGATDRLAIQHGYLGAYPALASCTWVTDKTGHIDARPVTLEYRFLVAMTGVLGIGADLTAWTANRRDVGRRLVDRYKDLRPIVFGGEVRRHGDPRRVPYVIEYGRAPGDPRVCLFVFDAQRNRTARLLRVFPSLLDPSLRYRVAGSKRPPLDAVALATSGVVVPFAMAQDCDLLVLEPVETV